MPKNSFADWDTTAANNTDIASIDIDEFCAPSGMNNAIRSMMAQLKSGVPGLATSNTFTATQTITSTDAGAAAGPLINLYRDSASPAASDRIGQIVFYGEDSAGNQQYYGSVWVDIDDPTSTSEDSSMVFNIPVAGSNINRLALSAVGATFTGQLLADVGSVSLPAISFAGDPNTGLYALGADSIGLTVGGTHVGHWNSTGWTVSNTSGATTFGSVNAVKNLISGGGQLDITNTTGGAAMRLSRASGSDGTVASIHYAATSVGTIAVTGSGTATAYNTSSDYRLPWKAGATPVEGSGEFIDALRPMYFPEVGFAGFIADQFAEVSPSSVTGEKDAVDENGAPIYQSMQPFSPDVMANLIAEIQSLRQRLAAAGL